MAIEFNCQFCSAMIRVPDSAGGGKGKCPRCARRITVPKVSTKTAPKPTDDEFAGLFAEAEPDPEPPAPADPNEITFAAADPVEFGVEAPVQPMDLFRPQARALGELPVEAPRQMLQPGSIASRLKKRKSGGGWMIPIGFGGVLCAVVGWFLWQQYQTVRLSGDLTAQSAAVLDLPPVELDNSFFNQPPGEMQAVLTELAESPIRLPSTLMLIQIGATKRAIAVQVNSGPQTQFYKVETSNDPGFINYRKNQSRDLEQMRSDDLTAAATRFVTEYQQVMEKKAGPNILSGFRNSLALPALVRGVGHQVIAVYGNTPYPCVYEDRDGALYFLLPTDVQGFEISGRKHNDGRVIFHGSYKVKVTGAIPQPASTKSDAGGKKSKPASSDDSKTNEMQDDDDGMKKKMDDKPKMDQS
ncbi:MAG: hypothetical protein JSS49_15135 [Planctomycetes bacterium]|nr:hypothetical protein [Planctomycetota bacterium]